MVDNSSAAIFVIFPGREIPSLFILVIKVVLGNPSRAAAPYGPPIVQSVASNVFKIKDRMQSLNVPDLDSRVAGSRLNSGVGSNSGTGLGSTPSFDRMTARSIRF